jgi:hypothetical protein
MKDLVITIAFIAFEFLVFVAGGAMLTSNNDVAATKAIAECQKHLPRDKVCVAVITAKVKE